MEKTYWAVVAGQPVPEDGQIDQPLKRVASAFGERTVPPTARTSEGQRAYTNYRTLDTAGRKLAWLELQPLTGRTHQLRVHCVSLGTPIVGDEKYAEPRDNGSGGSFVEGLADRLHLHARALTLPHPAGGTLTVMAPACRRTCARQLRHAGVRRAAPGPVRWSMRGATRLRPDWRHLRMRPACAKGPLLGGACRWCW